MFTNVLLIVITVGNVQFELFEMWLLVEMLGFMCLPLTLTVLCNLPDCGWALNKALGVVVVAFTVWLPLMCFRCLPFLFSSMGASLCCTGSRTVLCVQP